MGTERTEKPACRIRGMVRAAVILGAGLAVGVIIRFSIFIPPIWGICSPNCRSGSFLVPSLRFAAGHRSRLLEQYLASASECLPPITPLPG